MCDCIKELELSTTKVTCLGLALSPFVMYWKQTKKCPHKVCPTTEAPATSTTQPVTTQVPVTSTTLPVTSTTLPVTSTTLPVTSTTLTGVSRLCWAGEGRLPTSSFPHTLDYNTETFDGTVCSFITSTTSFECEEGDLQQVAVSLWFSNSTMADIMVPVLLIDNDGDFTGYTNVVPGGTDIVQFTGIFDVTGSVPPYQIRIGTSSIPGLTLEGTVDDDPFWIEVIGLCDNTGLCCLDSFRTQPFTLPSGMTDTIPFENFDTSGGSCVSLNPDGKTLQCLGGGGVTEIVVSVLLSTNTNSTVNILDNNMDIIGTTGANFGGDPGKLISYNKSIAISSYTGPFTIEFTATSMSMPPEMNIEVAMINVHVLCDN